MRAFFLFTVMYVLKEHYILQAFNNSPTTRTNYREFTDFTNPTSNFHIWIPNQATYIFLHLSISSNKFSSNFHSTFPSFICNKYVQMPRHTFPSRPFPRPPFSSRLGILSDAGFVLIIEYDRSVVVALPVTNHLGTTPHFPAH